MEKHIGAVATLCAVADVHLSNHFHKSVTENAREWHQILFN